MAAKCQLETIRRIHLLRDELENSLRATAAANGSTSQHQNNKRHLSIVFRSGEVAQIQILDNAFPVPDLDTNNHNARHVLPSRFTVSPTPNAMPATMTDKTTSRWCSNNESTKPRPLHVMITAKHDEMEARKGDSEQQGAKFISLSPPPPLIFASSPASSIDSGVASPGGASDFHLSNNDLTSPQFPSWATVPRTKRRVFNFTGAGSLIDALALSSPGKYDEEFLETKNKNHSVISTQQILQKKNFEYGSTNQPLSQTTNNKNGYFSALASDIMQAPTMQRQLSEGSSQIDNANITNGLPPRAATMPPLKSILKKPKVNHAAQTGLESPMPRNHQRRMPTRIVLSRSISEGFFDLTIKESAATFNATILGELCPPPHLDTLDENFEGRDDEDVAMINAKNVQKPQEQSRAISSSSSCSTETIDSEDIDQPAPLTKKRVSFSEHVQARIYRSNSSILGQRRKNEKKARQRSNRRSNSDTADVESEDFGTEEIFKSSSPPICRVREGSSVFSSQQKTNSGVSVLAQ